MNQYEYDAQLSLLKQQLVEIVLQIDEICKKNDLQYVIVAGTLLGAVRHQGFIPWDDDLDIAMPREDYEKFIQISSKAFPDDLYIRCFETDKEYYLPFGKVCKKGTAYITEMDSDQTKDNEIFIDIFPLDKAKRPHSISLKMRALLVKGIKAVIIRKKGIKVESTSIKVKVLQLLCCFISNERLMDIQKRFMILFSNLSIETGKKKWYNKKG